MSLRLDEDFAAFLSEIRGLLPTEKVYLVGGERFAIYCLERQPMILIRACQRFGSGSQGVKHFGGEYGTRLTTNIKPRE